VFAAARLQSKTTKQDRLTVRCCRQRSRGARAPTKDRDMSTLQSLTEPKMAAKSKRHRGATTEVTLSVVETDLERL
jgi:hypothetical protein